MKEKIVEILMKELDYSEYAADITADDLLNIQPQLQPALRTWLESRAITEAEALGFSVTKLMEQREYTFPAALIAIDWLLTEPDVAKKELSNEVIR